MDLPFGTRLDFPLHPARPMGFGCGLKILDGYGPRPTFIHFLFSDRKRQTGCSLVSSRLSKIYFSITRTGLKHWFSRSPLTTNPQK